MLQLLPPPAIFTMSDCDEIPEIISKSRATCFFCTLRHWCMAGVVSGLDPEKKSPLGRLALRKAVLAWSALRAFLLCSCWPRLAGAHARSIHSSARMSAPKASSDVLPLIMTSVGRAAAAKGAEATDFSTSNGTKLTPGHPPSTPRDGGKAASGVPRLLLSANANASTIFMATLGFIWPHSVGARQRTRRSGTPQRANCSR
jgi:hypothetical protein